MDTRYIDAVNALEDMVLSAFTRVEKDLSRKEVADELRRIAQAIENGEI